MADLQNQIIALRRQISQLENTSVVFNIEPKNPTTQTVYVNSSTGETKYWTGKEWVITSGTGGGGLTGWNTTVVFTATDYRTIAWAAGVVSVGTATASTDYATTLGSVTMASTTYFYWQADAPTAIQTTSTPGNVVIAGGILIAVGRLNPDTANKASLKVFGGPSVDQIIADQIVANSITSNMLQANSITASKIATTLLYAGAITLDTNGLIKGGQTAYDTGTGFFLGYSGAAYKFSIGNSAGNKLLWTGSALEVTGVITSSAGSALDGAHLQNNTVVVGKLNVATLSSITADIGAITAGTITGTTITGGTIQTTSSGARIELSSTNGLRSFDSSGNVRTRLATSGEGFAFFNTAGVSNGRIQGHTPSSGTFSGVRFVNIDNNGTSGDGNLLVDNQMVSGGDTYLSVLGTAYTTRCNGKLRIPVGSNLY